MEQVQVNKIKIYPFKSKAELIDYVIDKHKILIAIGVEKLLNTNKEFINIVNTNIAYSDGFGSVMALKKKGYTAEKIPGAYLWLDIIKTFYKEKSFYLIGATQEILEQTINKLKQDFENINIVNYRNGYFSDNEIVDIQKDIVEKKPDIVFVALGSPKQEILMRDFLQEHPALYMGLGGSFDLYVGKAKPVPDWWKKTFKWEGLYRSFNDIGNIKRWKRQLIVFKFFYLYIFNKL